jgi:RNA polymerase sigma factor (sigma-70 family)
VSFPSTSSNPAPRAEQTPVRWFIEEVQPHESALKSWLHARFPWLLEVDDVTQDALLRLWRRQTKANGTPIKSPKALLFAIAHNAVVDLARRRKAVKMESAAEHEFSCTLDENEGVVETVIARQELEFLADAIRQLPNRCRQVITLTKLCGLTEKEIARKLGISDTTVRTHVVRGMERCTEYLHRRGVNRNSDESR